MRRIIKKVFVLLLMPLILVFVSCDFNFINSNNLTQDSQTNKNVNKEKNVDPSNDTLTLDTIKQPNKESFNVSHVIDGDTISIILKDGKKQSIRLYGIDTPETLKPTNKNKLAKLENLYAQRSKDYLKNIVKKNGNKILIQRISEDRFKRIVAIIYSLDGKNINNYLVRNGQAMVYYISSTKKGIFFTKNEFQREYLKVIQNSQQKARIQKIGFWNEKRLSDVYFQRDKIDFD